MSNVAPHVTDYPVGGMWRREVERGEGSLIVGKRSGWVSGWYRGLAWKRAVRAVAAVASRDHFLHGFCCLLSLILGICVSYLSAMDLLFAHGKYPVLADCWVAGWRVGVV